MAATKTTALPTTVTTPKFLEPGSLVGITTKNSYELGTVIAVTGAYIAYLNGETECAVPWAHVVKVDNKP